MWSSSRTFKASDPKIQYIKQRSRNSAALLFVLFSVGGFEPIVPALCLGVGDLFTQKEQKKVQHQSTPGNQRIGQEGNRREGGVENKHGIDAVSLIGGYENLKYLVAIQADDIHQNHSTGDMGHIPGKIDPDVTEGADQQHIKQQGCVGKDAFGHIPIPQGGIEDEIHIGKHAHKGRENAEPEQIICPKACGLGLFIPNQAENQTAPHHHIAGINGQNQIWILPQVFCGGTVGEIMV